MSTTNGMPDEIDAAGYVMNIIRGIRTYPAKRRKEVEATPISEDLKGSGLQLEKAYKKGYLDAINDFDSFIQVLSKGI